MTTQQTTLFDKDYRTKHDRKSRPHLLALFLRLGVDGDHGL